VSGPDPTQRGLGPIPGVWFTPVEVLDLTRRSSPYVQGSGTFPWGSGPTVDTLEYIVFSGHVATPEPSTWWYRVLFTTRLEIVAWVGLETSRAELGSARLGAARCLNELGSARLVHSTSWRKRLGSARPWLASRLGSAREPYSGTYRCII
jgi:hypothetical protein